MAIHFVCSCGKKLRVQDEWGGKRIRCPACGEVAPVPKQVANAMIPLQSTEPPEASVDDTETDEVRVVAKGKRKKKKRKKQRAPAERAGVAILGIPLTIRSGLTFLFVVALLGGALYVLLPSYHPKLLEARSVDAYAALQVKNQNLAKENAMRLLTGSTEPLNSKLLVPGTEKFLVVHDNPDGQAVLLHLKLPPKFLQAHARSEKGNITIWGKDFVLQGDGESTQALLLDQERLFTDPAEGATMDFSSAVDGHGILPPDKPPWIPGGELTKDYQNHTLQKKQVAIFTCAGKAQFHGRRGLEVNYDYQVGSVTITWDSGSRGYVANSRQDFTDRFILENLDLLCVFPRPAGAELTLTVMGDKVGTIRPK
jgi:hypothetical protein